MDKVVDTVEKLEVTIRNPENAHFWRSWNLQDFARLYNGQPTKFVLRKQNNKPLFLQIFLKKFGVFPKLSVFRR